MEPTYLILAFCGPMYPRQLVETPEGFSREDCIDWLLTDQEQRPRRVYLVHDGVFRDVSADIADELVHKCYHERIPVCRGLREFLEQNHQDWTSVFLLEEAA